MEPSVVRTRLAAAVDTIAELHVFDHLPSDFEPPAFIAGEVAIDYDQVAEGGLDQFTVTGHLYTSRVAEQAGQKLLDGYLAPTGPMSVKAAVEADRTLGGAATTAQVQRVTGYSIYEVAGVKYHGARILFRVWGP